MAVPRLLHYGMLTRWAWTLALALLGAPTNAVADYSIPLRLLGQRIATLSAPDVCNDLLKEIIYERGGVYAELKDASAVLVVTDQISAALGSNYSNTQSLQAAIAGAKAPCPTSQNSTYVFLHIFKIQKDGQLIRRYNSSSFSCWTRVAQNIEDCTSSPILVPDSVAVRFAADATPQQILRFMRGVGFDFPFQEDNLRRFTSFGLRVPPREMDAWLQVFATAPVIEEVTRREQTIASVDTARPLRNEYEVQASTGVALLKTTAPWDLAGRLSPFLADRYRSNAKIITLNATPNFLSVKVTGLRGEVMKHEGYWETIAAKFVVSGPLYDDRTSTLHVFLEGSWATGAGNRPPADESYVSMEPRYHKNLADYTEALATEAQRVLDQP